MKVQFDITPSELGSNCNDSFWKRLQGGIEGIDNDYKRFLEYLNGSREQTTTVGKYAGNDEKEEEEEEEEEKEEDDVDPEYEKFLNQLTQCGKSYALKVHDGGGKSILVKYHGVDDSDEYWDPPARRKLSKRMNVGEGLSRHAVKREQTELSDHQRDVERNIKLADRQNLRSNLDKERSNLLARKKLRSETMNHVSHGVKACPRQRFVVEDDDMSEYQRNCETNDIEIDGCYQTFLNGIQNEGECLVFVHGGKRLVYENDYIDNGSDSDSEILMWSQDECLNQTNYYPSVLRKRNLSIDEEDSKKEVSVFRRKVMSILQRPYDEKEYEKLLRDIQIRKPMKVHREMRRPKSVSVDRLGKSYLDHHPDLKRKIEAVKSNRPRLLNILRGFFFWMNNVCHEERIFKPWKDPSCLAVVPTSK